MKIIILISIILASCLSAGTALAANLVCDVYPRSGGQSFGNGTSNCFGFDFSFGNSTNGNFYLQNISKPINQVIWSGAANCSGGTSCNVTVRAYSVTQGSALVLYTDGTYEQMNTATTGYETGY